MAGVIVSDFKVSLGDIDVAGGPRDRVSGF